MLIPDDGQSSLHRHCIVILHKFCTKSFYRVDLYNLFIVKFWNTIFTSLNFFVRIRICTPKVVEAKYWNSQNCFMQKLRKRRVFSKFYVKVFKLLYNLHCPCPHLHLYFAFYVKLCACRLTKLVLREKIWKKSANLGEHSYC